MITGVSLLDMGDNLYRVYILGRYVGDMIKGSVSAYFMEPERFDSSERAGCLYGSASELSEDFLSIARRALDHEGARIEQEELEIQRLMDGFESAVP